MLPIADIAYLTCSAIIILFAGRHLLDSWEMIALDASGREGLAHSVAEQLQVRFYAAAAGFVMLSLGWGSQPFSFRDGMIQIAVKLGLLLLVIVFLQSGNMRSLMRYQSDVASGALKQVDMR
jgi:hypothetical protein